jgi:hypothetical protein
MGLYGMPPMAPKPSFSDKGDATPEGSEWWYNEQMKGKKPLPMYMQGAPSAQWQGYGQQAVTDAYGGGIAAREQETLDALQALARGEKSYALDEAQRRAQASGAGIQSRVLSSQAGGYNPALQRQAAMSSATSAANINALGQLAAQKERQDASRALMDAGSSALARRQALQKIQAGYAGMGLDERYRQAMARDQQLGLDIRGSAAGRAADAADLEEKKKLAQGAGEAATGFIKMGAMAGG